MSAKKNILQILIILITFIYIIPSVYSAVPTGPMKKIEKGLFGKSLGKTKTKKVKEPRKVIKAKKAQEKNDAKLEKDYTKFVDASRKHSIDIQTPEVQARMKENIKQTALQNKQKRKASMASSREAGKKYNR